MLFAALVGLAHVTVAQTFAPKVPGTITAGTPFNISTQGSGKATAYLIGMAHIVKRTIDLGTEVGFAGDDVSVSGAYEVIVCVGNSCAEAPLHVVPGPPKKLTFLLHPSRVPVSAHKAVNGTVFVFDRFHNTVLTPTTVDFRTTLAGGALPSSSVSTVRGIASFQTDAQPKQGALEVTARLGESTEPRMIQQVASEACALRMTATKRGASVILQTDPIRDCSGNALPDGTIVSFTKIDASGKSTVDTPIKRDKAVATFQMSGPARISVACGVVSGNELSVGGNL